VRLKKSDIKQKPDPLEERLLSEVKKVVDNQEKMAKKLARPVVVKSSPPAPAPETKPAPTYVFNVERDRSGRIKQVIASPQEN